MPVYNWLCGAGHVTEARAARDTELRSCPCGLPAARQSVYAIGVSGFARTPIDQRLVKIGAFQEASAELEYEHSRQTNVDGSERPTPPLWQAAKAEAKRLRKLGVQDSSDVR